MGTISSDIERAEALPAVEKRLVWVIVDGRSGDNAQLLRIVNALGWPCRQITANRNVAWVILSRIKDTLRAPPPAPAELAGGGPWPDVVLMAGGRNISFARQIRRASGGKSRLVVIGTPHARLSDLDLIVSPAQWRLPGRQNVLHTLLPFNWPAREAVRQAALHWKPRLESLPRPWLAVSVGGMSSSHNLTRSDARRLARQINAACEAHGGAALITTSRRTPRGAADVLERELRVPRMFNRWQPNGAENPYLGSLALADRFLVTNDSASMIADALRMNRPVELFEISQKPFSRLMTHPWIIGPDGPDGTLYTAATPAQRLRRWLIESGYWYPPRDLARLVRQLDERGLLGERTMPLVAPLEADLERTTDAIRALFPPAEATVLSQAA